MRDTVFRLTQSQARHIGTDKESMGKKYHYSYHCSSSKLSNMRNTSPDKETRNADVAVVEVSENALRVQDIFHMNFAKTRLLNFDSIPSALSR